MGGLIEVEAALRMLRVVPGLAARVEQQQQPGRA